MVDVVGESRMSYEGPPAPPRLPAAVAGGANLLALAGVFSAGRVVTGVLDKLMHDGWSPSSRAVFLGFNGILLAFSLFLLVLAFHVRRGRQWAWIMSIVLLPFALLYGGLLLLLDVLNDSVPFAGIGVLLASVTALVSLTVPPSARAYFLRRPAVPPVAGFVPGPSWAPAPPPAPAPSPPPVAPATERRPTGS